ncbi:unnamed protein product, partial [Heterobilharzia americana]
MPSKCIAPLKALYSCYNERLKTCAGVSGDGGVRQGSSLSPFLFNFITDVLVEVHLLSSDLTRIDLVTKSTLVNLEHAVDI